MLDIDYFKSVNDTFGHLFGDYVLKEVAHLLLRIVKKDGYVGRFGGEEFIIILPDFALEKAVVLAERIRSEIEQFPFEEHLHLTVSIGLSQYKNQVSIDFVKETDDLLYRAKQNGRNRVES
jgi:diguanylate cyclase (GGDEF)-like protein